MTVIGLAQIAIVLAAVIAAAIPLSAYIARVLAGERTFLSPVLAPVERVFYKLAGVDPAREQSWLVYTIAMLAFSVVGFVSLYALQRLQNMLPLNPQGFDARAGRSRLQHVDQLRHQHQLAELWRRDDDESSHADARPHRSQFPLRRDRPRHGLRAGARLSRAEVADGRQFLGRSDARDALCAAAARRSSSRLRWSRSACRRRSPAPSKRRRSKAPSRSSRSARWRARRRSRSSAPMAAASSTPIPRIRSRTPTPGPICWRSGRCWSFPSRSAFAFGRVVGDFRQGRAIAITMGIVLVAGVLRRLLGGGRRQSAADRDRRRSVARQYGRQGGALRRRRPARLFAAATTGTSCGAVNSMHDSFTPLGGLVPLFNMLIGEHRAGRRRRRPLWLPRARRHRRLRRRSDGRPHAGISRQEDRGARDEARHAGGADLSARRARLLGRVGDAADRRSTASTTPARMACRKSSTPSPRPPATTARPSRASPATRPGTTRRSASRCCSAASPTSCRCWRSRARFAAKKKAPASAGTFPTHGPLFVGLLIGVILILYLLQYFPALALGPIVEHFLMHAGKTF